MLIHEFGHSHENPALPFYFMKPWDLCLGNHHETELTLFELVGEGGAK